MPLRSLCQDLEVANEFFFEQEAVFLKQTNCLVIQYNRLVR